MLVNASYRLKELYFKKLKIELMAWAHMAGYCYFDQIGKSFFPVFIRSRFRTAEAHVERY